MNYCHLKTDFFLLRMPKSAWQELGNRWQVNCVLLWSLQFFWKYLRFSQKESRRLLITERVGQSRMKLFDEAIFVKWRQSSSQFCMKAAHHVILVYSRSQIWPISSLILRYLCVWAARCVRLVRAFELFLTVHGSHDANLWHLPFYVCYFFLYPWLKR